MTDDILDHVNALLRKDKGVKKILEQIKRAAEQDEVISQYERNYIYELEEQYLQPELESSKEKLGSDSKKITTGGSKQNQLLLKSMTKSQKTKMYLLVGGIALAIILIVGVSQISITENPITKIPASVLTIETDLSSYNSGAIISVSGISKADIGNTLVLSIENAQGDIIWYENLKTDVDGAFSTLIIAGGEGWDTSGEYNLKAEHDNFIKQVSFNFKN